MKEYSLEKSYAMMEKARKVVPGGIYGPRTPAFLTYGSYPCFLCRGKGSHIWDVDGNEYIDYMCSFGTNILGLCNEEVDHAAIEQMKKGDAFTLPSDRWNETAEYMVDLVDGQDWIVFAKNGSDVTTFSTTIARGFTGKKKILTAQGAYHGAHYWCTHSDFGIPSDYQEHVLSFTYNNMDEIKTLIAQNTGNVAAVMVTPYHHPALGDQEMPAPGFYQELRQICDREGILIIVDDIRCGFRLDVHGSHCYFGFEPDMVCFGKAMGNGYPIAALMGKEILKASVSNAFFTGTHFFSAVPMAASLACMQAIERDGVVDYVKEMGESLLKGLEEQATSHNLKVRISGHPAMPFMRFDGDDDFSIARFFCGKAALRGVFLHPHHNWFLSGAHTEEDIKKTLTITDECFTLTQKEFGK
ncbi:MAG: aminotransferase class III-fold pyridoxal phosphate-dependent enzyme [Bacillota bacterium]|nr:aminotransferase class III-fold pyridoxal phosphate-dependent enzyme [Bacillota bacterium]